MTDWADVAAAEWLTKTAINIRYGIHDSDAQRVAAAGPSLAAVLRETDRKARESEREANAAEADNHECGGADDIICQHLNCGMVIAAAIRSRRGT